MAVVAPSEAPMFSLVIPAHNEAELLPRLLDTVESARSRYRGGASAVELIVADNGSTDATAEIAARRGCRVVEVARRCIGAARNGGVAAASGDVLAFVDADIRIHPDTFGAIADSLATGRVVAGATGVRLERWSPGIALTYAAMVPFVWLTGMDTGVVFCRRTDFEAVGGYDERLRAVEDVRLLLDLRRYGRRDGRHLVRLRRVKAVASMRKFDRHGDWHYFTLMPRIALGALVGSRRAGELVDSYWYRARD